MYRMNDPDGSAYIKGLCGDSMEMYLVIQDDFVKETSFFTDGCTVSIACGATVTMLAKGKRVMDVLRLSPADVLAVLPDLPEGNVHCAILAIMTLHKALADYLLSRQA